MYFCPEYILFYEAILAWKSLGENLVKVDKASDIFQKVPPPQACCRALIALLVISPLSSLFCLVAHLKSAFLQK